MSRPLERTVYFDRDDLDRTVSSVSENHWGEVSLNVDGRKVVTLQRESAEALRDALSELLDADEGGAA